MKHSVGPNKWVAVKDKNNPGQVKYVQRGHKKHKSKQFTARQTTQTRARTSSTRDRHRPTDTIKNLSHMGAQEQWQIEKGGSKWTKRDSAFMGMIAHMHMHTKVHCSSLHHETTVDIYTCMHIYMRIIPCPRPFCLLRSETQKASRRNSSRNGTHQAHGAKRIQSTG